MSRFTSLFLVLSSFFGASAFACNVTIGGVDASTIRSQFGTKCRGSEPVSVHVYTDARGFSLFDYKRAAEETSSASVHGGDIVDSLQLIFRNGAPQQFTMNTPRAREAYNLLRTNVSNRGSNCREATAESSFYWDISNGNLQLNNSQESYAAGCQGVRFVGEALLDPNPFMRTSAGPALARASANPSCPVKIHGLDIRTLIQDAQAHCPPGGGAVDVHLGFNNRENLMVVQYGTSARAYSHTGVAQNIQLNHAQARTLYNSSIRNVSGGCSQAPAGATFSFRVIEGRINMYSSHENQAGTSGCARYGIRIQDQDFQGITTRTGPIAPNPLDSTSPAGR